MKIQKQLDNKGYKKFLRESKEIDKDKITNIWKKMKETMVQTTMMIT